MKDYSFDDDEKKLFILNYEIEDDKIIINFAGGIKHVIPWTSDNEKIILEKMREQVLNSDEALNKFNKKRILGKSLLALSLFTLSSSFLTLYFNTAVNNLLVSAFFTASSIATIPSFILYLKGKWGKEDLLKNKDFLEHEAKINTYAKENNNIFANVSKRTNSLACSNMEDGRDALSINEVDYISLKDLSNMYDNIERIENFNFDCKPLVRKKHRD